MIGCSGCEKPKYCPHCRGISGRGKVNIGGREFVMDEGGVICPHYAPSSRSGYNNFTVAALAVMAGVFIFLLPMRLYFLAIFGFIVSIVLALVALKRIKASHENGLLISVLCIVVGTVVMSGVFIVGVLACAAIILMVQYLNKCD